MAQFWPALMWTMAWLPVGLAVRVVGGAVGFGLVAALKGTRLRRPAIAIGGAVNLCSLVVAAALPIVVVLAGLVLSIYWIAATPELPSGSAVLVGVILTAVITPIYLLTMVFTADQTPEDRA